MASGMGRIRSWAGGKGGQGGTLEHAGLSGFDDVGAMAEPDAGVGPRGRSGPFPFDPTPAPFQSFGARVSWVFQQGHISVPDSS